MSSSYPIVFYVSGHGFGHAARSIEIIQALLRRDPDARIIVKTTAPRRLFAEGLSGRLDYVKLQCDAGMRQIDSLNLDPEKSVRDAKHFQRGLSDLAAIEASFLRKDHVRAVVGDIPPLAFAAAHSAGVPSLAVGNFTWDWIYESYPEYLPFDLAKDIRRIYARAHTALRLPMAAGFAGLDRVTRDIPFVARQSRREPDEVRRALGMPPRAQDKPLLIMSFGGHGLDGLDTGAVAALKDFTIATTGLSDGRHGVKAAPELLHISEHQLDAAGLHYEDLVRAADVVVTKPGYGIISEAIANDTAVLYTARGRFPEYDVLVKEMPRYLRAQFIENDDLLCGRWGPALEKLFSQPAPLEQPRLDGADVAAEEILNVQNLT
jgi:L-arabinokinase